MTISASWYVETGKGSNCPGAYGPNKQEKMEVEFNGTPTNIVFAKALMQMGMSMLERSAISAHETRQTQQP